MSKDYRANVASYGFRGKYWDVGEVAKNVKPEENIPQHFTPTTDAPSDEPVQEPEINTLSELQAVEQAAEKPVKNAKKPSKK